MVTIDIRSTLIYLLFAALVILVIYLILLAKNLIVTVKETNKILKDAAVVSGVAADKAVQVDAVIGDVQSAVADISQAVKGQQNLIGALSNIVKAFGSLAAIFRKETEEEVGKKKSK